jgi:hypothetical protein
MKNVGLEEPFFERENRHVQVKRIYANRASGGDCHHCVIDGDIDAHAPARDKTG